MKSLTANEFLIRRFTTSALLTLFLLVALPIKLPVVDELEKFIALLEIHRQVGGENRALHHVHYVAVIHGRQRLNLDHQ